MTFCIMHDSGNIYYTTGESLQDVISTVLGGTPVDV